MAKKDKKSKKQVDDSWENDVETAPDNSAANKEEETPAPVSAPTKKGKKNKKQVDDSWENDIETAADPVEDKEEEAPAPVAAPSKKGKKNKKQVDDSWENDIETAAPAADSPADSGNATPTGADTPAGPQAPTEVTEIDDDDFGPIKKGKKGGKQAAASASPKEEPEEEEEETGGRVKTKKEKEKEKKEREKQRKKEQAARKKATEPAEKAAPVEEKKVEAAPVAEKPAAKDDKKGGKSKVPSGVAAALRKKLELQQKQAAELARIEEEERQRIEDEERAIREEEERKEQARLRKKEKEQAKKEELKKQGKYMTPAQKKAEKERLAKAAVRIEQMKAAGMTIEGLDSASTEAAPKKPSFDKKKKKGGLSKAEQEAKAAEERKKKEEADRLAAEAKAAEEAKKAAEAAEAANAEEDVLSSWEEAVDDDVKDSWDQDSDEEKAPEAVTKEETKGEKGEESEGEEDSDDSDDDSSDEEEVKLTVAQRQEIQRKEDAAARRKKELEEAKKNASTDDLRSPICCILGHVDTGKTKLLDKIRQTNVQEGEAGGITQQIGATYFPRTAIKEKTRVVDPKNEMEFKAPGLLIIDTPGHESFTNLRSRGSSLCNIAILVVDIMHGLEPQTLESIRLLRAKKTPFIVALNKIDRLYGWKSKSDNGFLLSLAKQKKSVQAEFRDRLDKTILAFAEQGLNSVLFSENKNMAKYVSLVPTSAHTGEGIPDMLKLLIDLTQQRMAEKLMYISSLECTVLEVKVIEGLGTTIDVILSNGVLREGDRIVLCGLNGAISTTVRALLTPQPMKELRVKAAYVHHKEIKAAMGIKIAANDLESAIAGSRLVVVGSEDNEEDIKEEVMRDLDDLLSKISTSGVGVAVQASTLGALEALLEFLRTSNIPVCTISIGPVSRRDVLRAGAMLEKHKEFAVMLCFDVKIEKEAQAYADEVGVKIFSAEIIYHLFDMFTAYQENIRAQERLANAHKAVFPCILKTNSVFNSKDPILLGVDIVEGSLRIGTPLAVVVAGKTIKLGRVTGIELNHKPMKIAKKGSPAVAVKIEGPDQPLMGRQVAEDAQVVSLIDRESIDVLRRLFREEVTKEEWVLIARFFKKLFDIPDPTKQAEPTKQVDAKAL